ncbi:unannotated protein [freshwater metagenome]
MDTPRPMTHDLLKSILDELGATLKQVFITELHDGTYYAELEIIKDGQTQRISSRPSDAFALAARYPNTVPIYAEESILEEAGVLFDQDDAENQITEFREFLDQVKPEDFFGD